MTTAKNKTPTRNSGGSQYLQKMQVNEVSNKVGTTAQTKGTKSFLVRGLPAAVTAGSFPSSASVVRVLIPHHDHPLSSIPIIDKRLPPIDILDKRSDTQTTLHYSDTPPLREAL
jgi:hypothetical protein